MVVQIKIFERISVDTIIRDQGYDNLKGYRELQATNNIMCIQYCKEDKDLQKFVQQTDQGNSMTMEPLKNCLKKYFGGAYLPEAKDIKE